MRFGSALCHFAVVATAFTPISAFASKLWVGNDTSGPVQLWTTGGVSLGTFGAGGATGTALDGAFAWTVQPSGSDSVITKYNASQTPLATINFTSGIENGNGFPSWIEDMASGANHTLWLSGFNGEIYQINSAGSVLTNFNTPYTFTGIEVIGNSIYTDGGFSGNENIYQYDMLGNLVGTLNTNMTGAMGGLAYDPITGTWWVGTSGALDQIDSSGNVLTVLSIGGGFHDGLAIGDLTGGVPEPSTWTMMLFGFAGIGYAAFRRRTRPAHSIA